jgi:transcriptional regulator with XRE-family HTH domain
MWVAVDWPIDRAGIGRRLGEARKRAGLTQEHVGLHFGVNKTQVSHWESGDDLPRYDKLVELCRLYGESIHYILTEDRQPKAANAKELAELRGVRPTRKDFSRPVPKPDKN